MTERIVEDGSEIDGNMSSGTMLKLARSISEQNVYFAYVCLVDGVKPSGSSQCDSYKFLDGDIEEVDQDDDLIQVERSKAVHELVKLDARKNGSLEVDAKLSKDGQKEQTTTTSRKESSDCLPSPNILRLTKMKWLTEEQIASPDSSSPSISPSVSCTSIGSGESEDYISRVCVGDKYLSTILRLDREHNMFGLSNIAIVGTRPSRKIRRDDEKPVFPQTAIVQVCCGRGCCRNKSNTDLPSSLKCGGCRRCCFDPICTDPCDLPCNNPAPCPSIGQCPPTKCVVDCATCYGMKIALHRKPKYEPSPIELTPRSSSVLQKPFAARSCHHLPRCVPPSSCFPYLMPCFWPARPSAPCSVPARCFHNPPCIAPRKPRPQVPPTEVCPPKCESLPKKCQNQSCRGIPITGPNIVLIKEKKKKIKQIKNIQCECSLPDCASCFVKRPQLKGTRILRMRNTSNRQKGNLWPRVFQEIRQISKYLPYLSTPTITHNS